MKEQRIEAAGFIPAQMSRVSPKVNPNSDEETKHRADTRGNTLEEGRAGREGQRDSCYSADPLGLSFLLQAYLGGELYRGEGGVRWARFNG